MSIDILSQVLSVLRVGLPSSTSRFFKFHVHQIKHLLQPNSPRRASHSSFMHFARVTYGLAYSVVWYPSLKALSFLFWSVVTHLTSTFTYIAWFFILNIPSNTDYLVFHLNYCLAQSKQAWVISEVIFPELTIFVDS